MPKNKGHNAFYYFMLDWKKRMEATGRKFPDGLKDVHRDPACSEEWNNMSKQKKGYYVAKQKESKVSSQVCMEKHTSVGEKLRELEEEKKQQEEFEDTMQKYIENVTFVGRMHNNLDKLKFIFIHVNYFCVRIENTKNDYVPAEFAVAEFSLENGIEDIYHEIINCPIPLGYRNDAIEYSQETHQIPIEYSEAQDNFALMYEKLEDFLKSKMTGNTFPPLFTLKKFVDPTHSLLKRLYEAANITDAAPFPVYSLEALFSALLNIAFKNNMENQTSLNIPVVLAAEEFAKNSYFSVCGIECPYHKNIDGTSRYCSMALTKQWSYTICDHCCVPLGVPIIPGVHQPIYDWRRDDTVDTENISLSMNSLTINPKSHLCINGVTEEHRQKVSERTYEEEQRRRNHCKPLEIIDHSKINSTPAVPIPQPAPLPLRPLRLPKTKSYALVGMQEDSKPDLNDTNFPPIGGRGVMAKKNTKEVKLPIGRGRGKAWKDL